MDADNGLFAQDQWTIHRMTLNLGLLHDYFGQCSHAGYCGRTGGCLLAHAGPVNGVPV